MTCPHLDLGLLNYPPKSSCSQKPHLSFKENKNVFSHLCLELNISDKTSVSHFFRNNDGGDTPSVCSMLQFVRFIKFTILPVRHSVKGV